MRYIFLIFAWIFMFILQLVVLLPPIFILVVMIADMDPFWPMKQAIDLAKEGEL